MTRTARSALLGLLSLLASPRDRYPPLTLYFVLSTFHVPIFSRPVIRPGPAGEVRLFLTVGHSKQIAHCREATRCLARFPQDYPYRKLRSTITFGGIVVLDPRSLTQASPPLLFRSAEVRREQRKQRCCDKGGMPAGAAMFSRQVGGVTPLYNFSRLPSGSDFLIVSPVAAATGRGDADTNFQSRWVLMVPFAAASGADVQLPSRHIGRLCGEAKVPVRRAAVFRLHRRRGDNKICVAPFRRGVGPGRSFPSSC